MTEKPHKLANFFREVWRRHVLQVALPYCVGGWLLIEVSEVVLQAFEAPNWILQTILITFLVGLPIVIVLAWVFDFTAAGLVRTLPESAQQATPPGFTPVSATNPAPAMAVSLGDSERRQVTMLNCSFEFQTSQEADNDPEFLRDATIALEGVFKDVTNRYQGHRLVNSAQILTLVFGYPTAKDDDARRAVAAGLALLDAAQVLDKNHDGIPDMTVQVGVHTGPVVIDESRDEDGGNITLIGQVPRLTAWLLTLAPPGSVAISHQTRELVDRYYGSESLGLQRQAPSGAALEVFRVKGAVQALAFETGFRQVGRAAELLQLQARWQHTMDGDGQFVLIKGEPGIGKSSLVNTFAQEILDTASAWVLPVYCSPYEQKTALYPLMQALQRSVLRFEPGDSKELKWQKLLAFVDQRCQGFEDALPLLARLLSLPTPEHLPALTGSAQQIRSRSLELLIHIIRQQARSRPFLLIVEDLLSADPTTLEWIQRVVEEGPSHGLFMLMTARPDFTANWARRSYVLSLDLLPLASRSAGELLRQSAGDVELPAPLIEHIIRETGGNPLYVHELTRAVLESDAWKNLPAGSSNFDPGWMKIPATLKESLAARLDHLGTAKALLQLCSVLGRDFDYEQLRAVSATENEVALRRELDTIVQSELLLRRGHSSNPGYTFKHILIQETAYHSLLKSKRRELHLRTGKIIEEQYPEIAQTRPALLAWHFGEAGDSLKAATYWMRAASLSLQSFANFEAITQAQSGLEAIAAMSPSSQRSSLEIPLQSLLGKGLLATRGYAAPEVLEAFTRARDLCEQAGDSPQLFQVMVGLWMYYQISAHYERALELSQALMRTADASGDPVQFLQARYCLGYTLYFRAEFQDARKYLEEAMASEQEGVNYAAQSASGDDTRSHIRVWLAHLYWHLGYPRKALEHMDQAVSLARLEGHPFAIAFATFNAAWFHVVRHDPERALPFARTAFTLANENDFGFFQSAAHFMLTWTQGRASPDSFLVRDQEVVDQLLDCVKEARANGSRLGHSFLMFTIVEDMIALDDCGAADSLLESTWAEVRSSGEGFFAAEYFRLKGLISLRCNADAKRAESCFREAWERARQCGSPALGLRAANELAEMLERHGEYSTAHKLLQEALDQMGEKAASVDVQRAEKMLKAISRNSAKKRSQ